MTGDFEDLETEILEKIQRLSRRTGIRDSAVLRTGPFRNKPVRIYAPLRYSQSNGYLFTPDSLCHYLTIHGISPATKISQIWILPQLILSDKFLMSHIWAPVQSRLIFYMCPPAFYGKLHLTGDDRYDTANPAQGKSGLLAHVFARIDSEPDKKNLHKFLIDRKELSPEDIEQMQNLSDTMNERGYNAE